MFSWFKKDKTDKEVSPGGSSIYRHDEDAFSKTKMGYSDASIEGVREIRGEIYDEYFGTSAQAETAVKDAIKHAALVPLEVARNALVVIDLAGQAILKGNKNAASDGAVAAMNARTAALAALYNVYINLSSVDDVGFVERLTQEAKVLQNQVAEKEKEVLSHVSV